ncbi:hypothetical protein BFF94_005495 [Burkholderia catarinensis]|nr:hypothetical protein BFF94_005495 [Burkholderia catarinensis]
MRESIGQNDRPTIANPCASIGGFPPKLIAWRSAMAGTRPARPIVARCGFSGPDADQVRTCRAPSAGMRGNRRRTGLRGPPALDSRATRTTLEYESGRPVCPPFRAPGFRPADSCKTR